MLEIPIDHDDAHDCLDDVIVAIANWYGCGHELMFANSLEFDFIKPILKPNEAVNYNFLNRKNDRFKLIGKYHGLELGFHNIDNIYSLIYIIKDELSKQKPIAISVDTFWCPWDTEEFQINHSKHYCIVVGMDEEKQILYCIDGQIAHKATELPFYMLNECYNECYNEGYNNYIIFKLNKDLINNFEYREIIDNAIKNTGYLNKDKNMFSNIETFSQYLKNDFDYNREIIDYQKHSVLPPIIQKIFDVSRSRKQYAKALKYISDKTGIEELSKVYEKLNKSGNTWSSIFGMLLKSTYVENPQRIIDRVSNKVIEVSELEKLIVKDLIRINSESYDLKSYVAIEDKKENNNSDFLEYYYVNLEGYFNNQGFSGLMTQECTAEFSNIGRYFLKEGLPEKKDWVINKMKFNFSQISEGKYDNMSCLGQKISIESNDIYTSIMFLGCAELGNHSEKVLIEYEDGTSEYITIEFTSWLVDKPLFDEYIAWKGKAAIRTNTMVDIFPFSAHIFAKDYQLNCRKRIKNIIMPECPNIHIFSISLAAK